MQQRKDIDGLRAIAVGGVVVYHALPSALPGGFVGVDVFFVLSGFLITAIIASDTLAGRFSIAGFYERRFRRILPALIAMLVVTSLAALVILPPGELRDYGRSLVWVAAFVSNIGFWHAGGYFAAAADDKPLLHTWSLAVEEQFYIFWPLIAAGLLRLGRRRLLKAFVWATVILSLAAAEFAVRHWPTAAFFLLPYRAWELGFGALLAVGAVPAIRGQLQREVCATLGLALIGLPMLLYSDTMRFPCLIAVPPCLGTMALIHAGQGYHTRVGRLLSWPPILFTGLISYSFYLWHWPVLVLGHIGLNRPLTAAESIAAIIAAYALAAISLRLVEKPFRGRGTFPLSRRAVLAGSASGLLVAGIAGATVVVTDGFLHEASPGVRRAEMVTRSINPLRAVCHNNDGTAQLGPLQKCEAGTPSHDGQYQVLLLGDSHADHLAPGLAVEGRAHGFTFRQATASGCGPTSIILGGGQGAHCAEFHRAVLDEATRQDALKAVVISVRWSSRLQELAASSGSLDGARHELENAVTKLVTLAEQQLPTHPAIILLGSTPEFDFWPANCAARAAKMGSDVQRCALATPRDTRFSLAADAALARAADRTGARFVSARSLFCVRPDQCATMWQDTVLFRDDDHLSNEGSVFLADRRLAMLKLDRRG